MKNLSLTIFLAVVISAGCLPEKGFARELTVAVAANVQFAFDELSQVFEKDTGISVKKVVGSSGKLTAQIENGAPFDVFLSANTEYPLRLIKSFFAVSPMRIYAKGSLVLWSLTKKDFDVDFLSADGIKKIAIADPRSAPYGVQARHVLHELGIYDLVKEKLVFGESIGQVNQFVLSGVVDLGITARSVVVAPKVEGQGYWVEISPMLYEPIEQGCVVLRYGNQNHPKISRMFFDFLFSQKAQDIFRRYGYMINE